MKYPRTHLVTSPLSPTPSRGVSKNNMTKTRSSPKPATHPGEPIGHCYRALLETSSSAILLLSPESIILGWNRAAETVSGWIADEALSRSYAEGGVLQLPQGTLEAHADDEHHREPVRGGAAAHRCRQAVQENGERDSEVLAVAAGRGEAVPQDRCAAPGQRNPPRRRVRGWSAGHEAESEGRRLRSFTHLFTQAPFYFSRLNHLFDHRFCLT